MVITTELTWKSYNDGAEHSFSGARELKGRLNLLSVRQGDDVYEDKTRREYAKRKLQRLRKVKLNYNNQEEF